MTTEKRVHPLIAATVLFAVLGLACFAGSARGEDATSARLAAGPAVQQPADVPPRRVVIRFLTDSDFPPFNFYDEDGVLVGFNVDLARAICLELNTSCDIKARPWEELFAGLKSGEADAVIAAHKVTAAALNDVAFTERYFHTPGRFAGRKDSPQVDMTPSGLDGKRIAVARGSAHEAFLKAFFRDSPLCDLRERRPGARGARRRQGRLPVR